MGPMANASRTPTRGNACCAREIRITRGAQVRTQQALWKVEHAAREGVRHVRLPVVDILRPDVNHMARCAEVTRTAAPNSRRQVRRVEQKIDMPKRFLHGAVGGSCSEFLHAAHGVTSQRHPIGSGSCSRRGSLSAGSTRCDEAITPPHSQTYTSISPDAHCSAWLLGHASAQDRGRW
jgi:hypothetical protein